MATRPLELSCQSGSERAMNALRLACSEGACKRWTDLDDWEPWMDSRVPVGEGVGDLDDWEPVRDSRMPVEWWPIESASSVREGFQEFPFVRGIPEHSSREECGDDLGAESCFFVSVLLVTGIGRALRSQSTSSSDGSLCGWKSGPEGVQALLLVDAPQQPEVKDGSNRRRLQSYRMKPGISALFCDWSVATASQPQPATASHSQPQPATEPATHSHSQPATASHSQPGPARARATDSYSQPATEPATDRRLF